MLGMHTATASAKLNLGLHVLCRRTDGYHDLSTVFYPIGWADILTAVPAEHLTMTCTDDTLPADESNLVMKAARRLALKCGVKQGVELHLEKILPTGAGLGGGSSDAAAALRLLCNLWELEYSRDCLQEVALALGSDVPFFLYGRAAYATGRGERICPMPDYAMPFTLVVAAPPIYISTAWAFRQVEPVDTVRPDLLAAVRSNDLDRWRRELVNDFEQPVMKAWPELKAVREQLLDSGAGFVSMSGSGSAVYGVFESEHHAAAACEAVQQFGCSTWIEPASSK